ncbi:MAG TPA: RluA family pseudouridine synthase [Bacillota bacterium]|nr:RluA family pseudouridine synthase [Bacillota bacterium]
MTEKYYELTAGAGEAGSRLDLFIAAKIPSLSRARAQKLILAGAVEVEGRPCLDKNYRLQAGERIRVALPPEPPPPPPPQPIPLEIIYEDRDLLVVNKPRGMVVHPAPGHSEDTLVNALLYRCPELSGAGGESRPGIVHRLDKDTSGLLLVAKNDFTHQALAAQLKSRQVRREYLALVHGHVQPAEGSIDAPIGRHPRHRQRMAVVPEGRPAVTHYRVLAYIGPYSWLRVRLESGRTHQVRVHLAHLGHPVVGDPVYGPRDQSRLPLELRNRQTLHARRISFQHPRTGETMCFTAPLPEEIRRGLRRLRLG